MAVDEPIYRRLPCFLIATIDKFAALPWVGPSGKLFGQVERHDRDGFYSAAEPGLGQGWVLLFDLRKEVSWADKLFVREVAHEGKQIRIVGC